MIFVHYFIQIIRLSTPYEVNLDPSNWPKITKFVHFRLENVFATESVSPYQLAPMHTRDFFTFLQLVWVITETRKISAITRFQRIFSQFTRKLHFLKKNKTYLQKFYTKCFTSLFTTVFLISRMFSLFAHNGGFMTFEFLWPTTISPRNGSARKPTTTQDGKGLLCVIFYCR